MLPGQTPRLDRGRVRLRPFEPRDAALVRSVAGDPLIPLITTVPTSGSPADAEAFVARQRERSRSGWGHSFAVADAATDEAVGQIGLSTRDIGSGRATAGYWIGPAHRRHGWASAALACLTDWAFTIEEVFRVQLYVEPWNEGSWRTAERCGFQREGLLRSWELVGGQRRDMYMYSAVRAG